MVRAISMRAGMAKNTRTQMAVAVAVAAPVMSHAWGAARSVCTVVAKALGASAGSARGGGHDACGAL